jgi:competence protein ComEA
MNQTGARHGRGGGLRHAVIALALLGCSALALTAGSEGAPAAASAVRAKTAPTTAPAAARPLDINGASRQQLKTLPGIGDAEADRIVAGRPYLSKAGLVAAKAIPAGTYQSIRHSIIALPPATTRAP